MNWWGWTQHPSGLGQRSSNPLFRVFLAVCSSVLPSLKHHGTCGRCLPRDTLLLSGRHKFLLVFAYYLHLTSSALCRQIETELQHFPTQQWTSIITFLPSTCLVRKRGTSLGVVKSSLIGQLLLCLRNLLRTNKKKPYQSEDQSC